MEKEESAEMIPLFQFGAEQAAYAFRFSFISVGVRKADAAKRHFRFSINPHSRHDALVCLMRRRRWHRQGHQGMYCTFL
jgi:hypothetical protein